MPFTKHDVRDLYESFHCSDPAKQAVAFTREVCHMMGLTNRNGARNRNRIGQRCLLESVTNPDGSAAGERLLPSSFSLAELGRGILGDDLFESYYRPDSQRLRAIMPFINHDLLEAGEGAVGPGAYANVNAFTGVVAGLMEVSVLEGWQNPEYIGDLLAPVESTKMFEGRKKIGSSRLGDVAEERIPGMPTARAQIGERWISQPRTVENSLAVEVLKETVYLDQTGAVLEEANGVGEWLRYRKEIRIINAKIGVTNTYSFMGTTYTTYQTTTWDNNVPNNELLHENNLTTCKIKFRDMTDPQTGTRVMIRPNTILVNEEKFVVAQQICGNLAMGVEYRDIPSGPQNIRLAQAAYKGQFTIITSPLVYQRCTDADGLALSAADAAKYWWMFESGKALKYAENWPITVQQATPSTADMLDRGVALYVRAEERGIPFWQEPRRTVQNKPGA